MAVKGKYLPTRHVKILNTLTRMFEHVNQSVRCAYTNLLVQNESLTAGQTNLHDNAALKASHYTHLRAPAATLMTSSSDRLRATSTSQLVVL